MFERTHLQPLTKRIQEPRKFIQVIMGPRQVGKTTLVTQLKDKLQTGNHFVAADSVTGSSAVWLEQQWETARIQMDRDKAESYLLPSPQRLP